MGQKQTLIAFAIAPFIVGCAADVQLQSLTYSEIDRERVSTGILSGLKCSNDQKCATHYAPSPVSLDDAAALSDKLALSTAVDPERRNRIQTLLMMHADRACSAYRNSLIGANVGLKLGQDFLPQAINLLKDLIDTATGDSIFNTLTNSFKGAAGIIEKDVFTNAILVDKLKSVVAIKNKMRTQIIFAQNFPASVDSDSVITHVAVNGKKTDVTIKGVGAYSLPEAISDAITYHRTCDATELIIGNTDIEKATEGLFASKFIK